MTDHTITATPHQLNDGSAWYTVKCSCGWYAKASDGGPDHIYHQPEVDKLADLHLNAVSAGRRLLKR